MGLEVQASDGWLGEEGVAANQKDTGNQQFIAKFCISLLKI